MITLSYWAMAYYNLKISHNLRGAQQSNAYSSPVLSPHNSKALFNITAYSGLLYFFIPLVVALTAHMNELIFISSDKVFQERPFYVSFFILLWIMWNIRSALVMRDSYNDLVLEIKHTPES